MAITEAFTPHTEGLGVSGGTTTGINTTGANLLVVSISYYSNIGGVATLTSDSKGNTWTALTNRADDCGHRFYYCLSPTVGSGHTFTIGWNGSSIYPGVVIHGWSGVASFDQETGATTASTPNTTLATGALTPGAANALVLAAIAVLDITAASMSVNSGLTQTLLDWVYNVNVTAATGWKVAAASSINPTFTWTTSRQAAANMAIFLPTGGGGGGLNALFLIQP